MCAHWPCPQPGGFPSQHRTTLDPASVDPISIDDRLAPSHVAMHFTSGGLNLSDDTPLAISVQMAHVFTHLVDQASMARSAALRGSGVCPGAI